MTTWMSAYLQSFDDDPADNQDTDNNDARDKAQAEKFRQHATDDDGDTSIDLAVDNDFAQLAALRKLLDKDDDA